MLFVVWAKEIVDAFGGSEESGVAGSETCETLTSERKAALFLLRAFFFDLRLMKTLRELITGNQKRIPDYLKGKNSDGKRAHLLTSRENQEYGRQEELALPCRSERSNSPSRNLYHCPSTLRLLPSYPPKVEPAQPPNFRPHSP